MADAITSSNARIFVGTTAAASDQSGFEADTYTQILGVTDIGEFGDAANEVTVDFLENGRTQKIKGQRNAGNLELVVAHRADDAGQDALITAEGTTFDYNFYVELDDEDSGESTGTIFYFRAKVMSKRVTVGAADNIVSRTFTLGINSPIIEVAPAA
jgi:hypothetical protein